MTRPMPRLLLSPMRRAPSLRVTARLTARWRSRLVPVVAFECLAQPLQFQDQGLALRADIARRFVARTLQHIVTGLAIVHS